MDYTIDSSVWVASVLKTEPAYQKARDYIRNAVEKEQTIILPVTVYIEVAMALARRGELETQKEVLTFLLKLPTVNFVELDYSRMVSLTENISEL